ncbi:MAG TPA: Mur ligase family protein [Candidatus Saccharimonadales bacterium]|nr:Mur ligase family protein [Candidatus Saccharimonadales bacterium]
MKPITTFAEARTALQPLYNNARTKYDLTVMRQLMEYLGNPQNNLCVFHIAGTSGKTSTAYYVAALLKASGYSVGLTVSPHVDEINERVQIGLVPLPQEEFCYELTIFMDLVRQSKLAPSYFEVMVAFAYWLFAKKHLDYAVVEVGLGGLLDGTNVVDRTDKVCVITDIGLDHTEILGETISEIASQKAGIIQPENVVFMYEQDPEAVGAVQKACNKKHAVLHIAKISEAIDATELPLFQQHNLGLAIKATSYVMQRDHGTTITEKQIMEATNTHIPARMERFALGGKVLVVDGSHNAQKLGTLAESLHAAYPGKDIATLAAFVDGNDSRWQSGADVLMGLSKRIIVTSFQANQDVPKKSVAPEKVADYIESKGFHVIVVESKPAAALSQLQNSPEPVLLVAGSFYLLNNVRPLIIKQYD